MMIEEQKNETRRPTLFVLDRPFAVMFEKQTKTKHATDQCWSIRESVHRAPAVRRPATASTHLHHSRKLYGTCGGL